MRQHGPFDAPDISQGSETMRTVIASLLAASLLAGLAGTADAATAKKKKRYTATEQSQARSQSSGRRELSDFSRPEDLPTGSSEWWRAMDREGRGGQNRP
jgi:hypothetical protein